MSRAFGSTTIPAEINGNTFHLPDSLTGVLRLKHSKLISAVEKALKEVAEAEMNLDFLPSKAKADDIDSDELAKRLTGASDALKEANKKLGEAARKLVVALLTAPAGLPEGVPADIGDHLVDSASVDYVVVLLNGARYEADPQ